MNVQQRRGSRSEGNREGTRGGGRCGAAGKKKDFLKINCIFVIHLHMLTAQETLTH